MQKAHKLAALGRVLDIENPEATIVFCPTRNEVDEWHDRPIEKPVEVKKPAAPGNPPPVTHH